MLASKVPKPDLECQGMEMPVCPTGPHLRAVAWGGGLPCQALELPLHIKRESGGPQGPQMEVADQGWVSAQQEAPQQ